MKAFETIAAAATKHQDLLHSFEEQENERRNKNQF